MQVPRDIRITQRDIRITQLTMDLSILQTRERQLREIIESAQSTDKQIEGADAELKQVLEDMRRDVMELQQLEDAAIRYQDLGAATHPRLH